MRYNHLIEALNGTLTVVLFWMFFFGVRHLRSLYEKIKKKHHDSTACEITSVLLSTYHIDVAFVLLVTFYGFRTTILWLIGIVDNHEFLKSEVFTSVSIVLLSMSTLVLIAAIAYWLAAISPYRRAMLIWLAMIGSAILVGFGGLLLI